MSYTDFVLPADWADAITHGDYSRLTDDDLYTMKDTLMFLGLSRHGVARVSSHTFFTYKHDAIGVGGTECVIISFIND